MVKINNFIEGAVDNKDKIAPAYVDNQNPRYFEIDNMYFIGLIVTDYYREYSDIIFKNLMNANINMNLTCFYEKQDSYKITCLKSRN